MRESAVAADIERADLRIAAIPEDVTSPSFGVPGTGHGARAFGGVRRLLPFPARGVYGGDPDLDPVAPRRAGLQPDHTPRSLFALVPADPAGRRLEAKHVRALARHGPLHELWQLLGPEPHREGEPERRVLEPRLCPAVGAGRRAVVVDALREPRGRGVEAVP